MASTAAARYVSSSQPRSQPLPPAKPATAAPAPAPGLEAAEGSTPRAGAADLALLARLRLGDEAAFAELIDQHHGALLRLALVFVANRAMAEEVVQETWSAVLVGLDAFEGRSTLKTWILSHPHQPRQDARCARRPDGLFLRVWQCRPGKLAGRGCRAFPA